MKTIAQTLAILLLFTFAGCSPAVDRQLTISDFREALREAGLPVGEPEEMFYEMVQASDGAALPVGARSIEVYQYDTTIRSGKEAHDAIREGGLMGRRVIAHENLILLPAPDHDHWTEILAVFESL